MHHDLLGFYFQSALRVLQVKKEETNNEIVIYMLKCTAYNKNYLHQHLAERAESEFTPLKTRSSPNEILLFLFGKSNFPRHNSSFNGSMWRRPRCGVSLQRSVSPQV